MALVNTVATICFDRQPPRLGRRQERGWEDGGMSQTEDPCAGHQAWLEKLFAIKLVLNV